MTCRQQNSCSPTISYKCVYVNGARVRNCVEKDVVITVDKCRKERRNRNSRRLMTPSISFYTSCGVTKHQPSFLFRAFDAYSRVKSVHLERHPFPPLSCYLARFVYARPLYVQAHTLRDCVGARVREDNRYQTSISDMESKRVPGGARNEKLMARRVSERYYYFG